ncbi:MAG: PQQ-dependent sugar dehydrogenase [Halobacteriota archaeon]
MSPHGKFPHRSRRDFLRITTGTAVAGSIAGCLDGMFGDGALIGEGPTVSLETVADGLVYPSDLEQPPDGSDRLFVTDQPGQVYVIEDGEREEQPVIDVSDRMVDVGIDSMGGFDERGLLGIAFHPEFDRNGRFYLRYSAPTSRNVDHRDAAHVELLCEYDLEGNEADPDSERILLRNSQPAWIHNSGNIEFGPDGYLYITAGDGGGSFDDHAPDWYHDQHMGTGQNTSDNLLGGVLRIDVDGGDVGEYAIPPDNPLVDDPDGRDEYFAWGFRNPWGMAFDGDDLYVADVGQAMYESVNRVERGENYGWSIREGAHCYDPDAARDPPDDCPTETPDGQPLLGPVVEYPHEYESTPIGSAIIGGGMYRAGTVDVLDGRYVFGDWSADPHGDPEGVLFAAAPAAAGESVHEYYDEHDLWPIERLQVDGERDLGADGSLNRYVVSMGRDRDGELYVLTGMTPAVTGSSGEVHRIVPSGG